MEKILRNQILEFHNKCVVKKTDDALLHTVKKTGAELLDIDLDCKSTRLSRRAVFCWTRGIGFVEKTVVGS